MDEFANEISRHVWRTKYRFANNTVRESGIDETWRRIARTLAAVERGDAAIWEKRFSAILQDFKFLPGGRIQAGAGTTRNVTLFNCFVMGTIEDSMSGIFRALEEGAITMQQGGGIGIDFSTLRPRGTQSKTVGGIASGPVSFMQLWDAACGTILSTGARRGAMMATLRCDHPDIEEFVMAKQQPGQLRRFNLSVQVTDAFIAAVRSDTDWPLVFPTEIVDGRRETVEREWAASNGPIPCTVERNIRARHLWDLILRSTYDYAEPGVLFVDRINKLNNLWYREHISATNPCGEIPLPPYGACDLGSLNLTQFILSPFAADARIDYKQLADTVRIAVRLLDNVIDASRFPLPRHENNARGSRRIGLGITGFADALVMMGISYGSDESLAVASQTMRLICHTAYRTSIDLAKEKGCFPFFERDKYLRSPFIRLLPDDIQADIADHAIRNSHLLAIAPTGTISLLAGNVSSGIEPIFASSYHRKVLDETGTPKDFLLTDYALGLWKARNAEGLPFGFVTASELPVRSHLDMLAALQPYVDNSISKTISVPETYPLQDFKQIYNLAYDMGLKGCTTFRPNPVTGTVLSQEDSGYEAPHCCALEREAD